MIFKKQNMKGFTLIEILLGFGIFATLLVVAMVVYIKVADSSKENKSKEEIVLVQETVKDLTRAKSSYKDFNESILVSGNLLPMKMLKKKGIDPAIINTYKGNIYFESSDVGGETDGMIKMTYKNVSSRSCTKIIKDIGKNYYLVQVYNIDGDGGDVKPRESDKIDLNLLDQACDSKSNTILFYFH